MSILWIFFLVISAERKRRISGQLAVGSWQLAVGSWQLAVGSGQLAVGKKESAEC